MVPGTGQGLILMNEWTEHWKQRLANYLKVGMPLVLQQACVNPVTVKSAQQSFFLSDKTFKVHDLQGTHWLSIRCDHHLSGQ